MASTANIQEVIKFYNPGTKVFEQTLDNHLEGVLSEFVCQPQIWFEAISESKNQKL